MIWLITVKYLTIDQKPNGDDFAKARELIEIRGTGELSLHARRVMNVLYANAGSQLCDDVAHTIGMSELRGNHKGGERVRDSILQLMKTVVLVPVTGRNGKPATKRVQILSDTTTSDDEDDPSGQVIYSFSKGMREIIKDSTLWGRVRKAVIFAFTSKYSLALYELITARINLQFKWQEEFSVEDLRALLGVPDGKLERIPNLLQKVIRPAETEVNGLAEFEVRIEPIRQGGPKRGLVTGFRVSWWIKDNPALEETYKELQRSKVGRLPRLLGRVEKTTTGMKIKEELQALVDAEVAAKLAGMRAKEAAGAAKTQVRLPMPAGGTAE
jgi:hypothetical protein